MHSVPPPLPRFEPEPCAPESSTLVLSVHPEPEYISADVMTVSSRCSG